MTRKTLLWPYKITQLRVRRNRTIKATENAIIVKRRAILLGTAWNIQKTSVDFGNLHTGNW